MKIKEVKLSKKIGGKKSISYSVSLAHAEATACGFISESGEPHKLIKVIDEENQQIILKAKNDF